MLAVIQIVDIPHNPAGKGHVSSYQNWSGFMEMLLLVAESGTDIDRSLL